MANNDKEVKGTQENGGNPAEGTEQTTVVIAPQKTGLGTGLKIVIGLTAAAAFTGLGMFLRGLIGGRGEDDDQASAEAESPTE